MASEGDTSWLQKGFADDLEPGNRLVFGIIREAKVGDWGNTAFFIIDCSDGTVIEEEFVYPTLNPCDAVGSMAKLELSPDNRVGERRFKLLDEMRAARHASSVAESAQNQRREREEIERKAILYPIIEQIKRRANALDSILGGLYDTQIARVESMSLRSLRELQKKGVESLLDHTSPISVSRRCEQGTITLRMAMDLKGVYGSITDKTFENLDYSSLHLHSTTVTIELTPNKGKKLKITLSAVDTERLIGGVEPCTETYAQIYRGICERKGIQSPPDAKLGDGPDPVT